MGADRFGAPINKLLLDIDGLDPVSRCVIAFDPLVDEIVIVTSEQNEVSTKRAASIARKPVKIVPGGERRQDSVLCGLMATGCEIAAIHDCARCLVTETVISPAIAAAIETGSGVAAMPVRDTLRFSDTGESPDRSSLMQMQTPQCFDRMKLIEAYSALQGEATDDAAIWQTRFGQVTYTPGSIMNQKLTNADDIEFFRRMAKRDTVMRIGIGEDTHRLTEGRRLVLGGVDIPFNLGLLGHSDADALIHAVIDAVMGAAALGDIGRHFPDTDPRYEGISSLELLKKTSELLLDKGYKVMNIDATITAQAPKLSPYIEEMRKNIADAIAHIGIDCVSVKATTPERLGPEGELKSITVRAVASVVGVG